MFFKFRFNRDFISSYLYISISFCLISDCLSPSSVFRLKKNLIFTGNSEKLQFLGGGGDGITGELLFFPRCLSSCFMTENLVKAHHSLKPKRFSSGLHAQWKLSCLSLETADGVGLPPGPGSLLLFPSVSPPRRPGASPRVP